MYSTVTLPVIRQEKGEKRTTIYSELNGLPVEIYISSKIEVETGKVYLFTGQPAMKQLADKSKVFLLEYATPAGFPLDPNTVGIQLVLFGRLGKDPEIKFFDSGKSKARTSLAVTKNKNETSWYALDAWEKTAEIMSNYTKKGDALFISGRLQVDKGKDGDKLFDSVVVEKLTLMPKQKTESYSKSSQGNASVSFDDDDPGF